MVAERAMRITTFIFVFAILINIHHNFIEFLFRVLFLLVCAVRFGCALCALVMLRRCYTVTTVGGGWQLCRFFLYVYWLRNVCLLVLFLCRVYLGSRYLTLPDERCGNLFVMPYHQKVCFFNGLSL